jgi:hypothetical protein
MSSSGEKQRGTFLNDRGIDEDWITEGGVLP